MLRSICLVVMALSAAACASGGAVPRPFPTTDGSGSRRAPLVPPAARLSAVEAALSLRGTPYRNGGTDPSGFDCSGLVAYVFGRFGYAVPRTVSDQFDGGRPIDSRDLAPGDLVFFSTTAPGPSHVGIAISGTEFVHAPSSAGVVRVERLTAPYWASRFLGARRLGDR